MLALLKSGMKKRRTDISISSALSSDTVVELYKESFVAIGYIRKGHGFSGHAKVVLYDGYENVLDDQSFVFVEIEGYHVPFLIEERQSTKELLLKFEFIDSVEELKKFQGSQLYLLQKDVVTRQDDSNVQTDKTLVGLTIIDAQLGALGKIERVDSYPQQEMAIVVKDEKEILIPLHEELIEEINESEGWIKMNLPSGLLDI